MDKIDIKSAYRIVPVHPQDRCLLGMKWDGKVYALLCLLGYDQPQRSSMLLQTRWNGLLDNNQIVGDVVRIGTHSGSRCDGPLRHARPGLILRSKSLSPLSWRQRCGASLGGAGSLLSV